MSREWKPGDVVLVPFESGLRQMLVTEYGGVFNDGYRVDKPMVAAFEDVRPLVVIDPEDREQVERLYRLYASAPATTAMRGSDFLAHALREFADPKPPKPAEPVGLGAVVEDAKGRKWVRSDDTDCVKPWHRNGSYDDSEYADIDAARVISEGVTS